MTDFSAIDGVWLQTSLNKLGATPILVADGVVGAGTRTAVKAFQTSRGLPADGIAGPATVAAIKAALVPAAQSTPKLVQSTPSIPSITNPAPGSVGAWVKSLFTRKA